MKLRETVDGKDAWDFAAVLIGLCNGKMSAITVIL